MKTDPPNTPQALGGGMNRRHFISVLGLGATLALDPERLLWVPGARKIFIPPPAETVRIRTIYFKSGDVLTIYPDHWMLNYSRIFPGIPSVSKKPHIFTLRNIRPSLL